MVQKVGIKTKGIKYSIQVGCQKFGSTSFIIQYSQMQYEIRQVI